MLNVSDWYLSTVKVPALTVALAANTGLAASKEPPVTLTLVTGKKAT